MEKLINAEVIEQYINDNKLTIASFCKRCNISNKTYKRIHNSDGKVRITTLMKVVRVVGKSILNF